LRGLIQTWAAIDLGLIEIAQKAFLTPTTVKSTLLRNQQRHEETTLSRFSRPSKLSRRDQRIFLKYVYKNLKLTYEQILIDLSLLISMKTMQRILKEEDIKKWIAKQR
jgi:hypothetical protein